MGRRGRQGRDEPKRAGAMKKKEKEKEKGQEEEKRKEKVSVAEGRKRVGGLQGMVSDFQRVVAGIARVGVAVEFQRKRVVVALKEERGRRLAAAEEERRRRPPPPRQDEMEEERMRGWRWEHCVSGAVAGGAVEGVMYPLDTLKTRLQACTSSKFSLRITTKRLLRGGVGGLYAGCLGGMVGSAIADAVYFGTYEPYKEMLSDRFPQNLTFVAHASAAAIASLLAATVRVPSEVLKQRLQAGQSFRGPISAMRGIYRNYGVGGLYSGTIPLLVRDLPFNAIEFAIYENLKLYAKRLKAKSRGIEEWNMCKLSTKETGLIGAFSGALTAAVTTPMDVLKTRLMVQQSGARYANVMEATKTIVKEEGVAVLFRGMTPRLIWISFGGCIFFSVLEGMEKYLNQPAYTGLRRGSPAP